MNDQLAIFIDFENVALWAEREFFDFEVTNLMEHLQSRGPAVVKRAYADWSRFARYRDAMMNNSIDLIQIFSVRTGKNRADIRMAIDAFEIAMTRAQIHTFVIVSGDSDFGPLAAKLREYGRYTIGIGPRSTTHDLLVRSVDEFIYLETALGEPADMDEQSCVEIEQARSLLEKALRAHGQRGELPVAVNRLKQTMLLMNPAFNEANFGYVEFKSWLEDNRDIIKLFNKDLQLFGAPLDYVASDYLEVPAKEIEATINQPVSFRRKATARQASVGSAIQAGARPLEADCHRSGYTAGCATRYLPRAERASRRSKHRRAAGYPGGALRDPGADPQQACLARYPAAGLPPAGFRQLRPAGLDLCESTPGGRHRERIGFHQPG